MTEVLQFASLHHCEQLPVLVHPFQNLSVRDMFGVGDLHTPPVTLHLESLYTASKILEQGPSLSAVCE